MNTRRLNAFVDDLVAGARPRHFEADAEDAEILRAAIGLRAERPGDAKPDEAFIASLQDELRGLSDSVHASNGASTRWHRGRAVLFGVAAALALVGGSVALTESSTHGTPQQSATQVPNGQALRTATFESSTGQVMGQIVVFDGHPSWVFMDVDAPHQSGPMRCELHLANGDVVAAGSVTLHEGKGEITRVVHMQPGQVRGATLSNSSGVVLASATFA
jgi:hypothetical protein